MALYYPDDYGPYRGTRVETEGPQQQQCSRLKSLLHRVVRFDTQKVPPMSAGRFLEIGCASGSFLQAMDRAGWTVEGIEFSESAAEAARTLGYSVQSGSIDNATAPEGSYDLVAGWMVLEHLHEPVSALQKLHHWTSEGSRLAISTPNAASLERSFFGSRWYALDLPRHLYHYTPDTLASVLEAGGWRLERVFHQRVLGNILGSAGHTLDDSGLLPNVAAALASFPEKARLMNYALYPLALPLAALGQTGRMTAWARRIDG